MPLSLVSFILAFAGGALGAAIGGSAAFIFTGVSVLLGFVVAASGGGLGVLTGIAFGPVFGPHICFASGAAAAAYAARVKAHPDGRDIATPLMGVDRADVIAVGGIFGMFGYLTNELLSFAGLMPWTDTIALTVVLSGVVARYAFGRTGFLGSVSEPGAVRFRPDENASWVPWVQRPPQIAIAGLAMGLLSGYMAISFGADRGGDVVGFGIAGTLLIFLHFGHHIPVTHHIALPAALAAILSSSILFAGVTGIFAAFAGEAYARLFLIHGDTYIDPPAASIATTALLLRLADSAGWLQLLPLP